jgi:predicted nucleic acid-binding protein
MSWLLDVNVVLASRWITHRGHHSARTWIDSVGTFYTCPLTELGFVRISLSVAYRATWDDVQEALRNLQTRSNYRFLVDDIDGTACPQTDAKDTTDAHLVTLAKRHGLKLATLDATLVAQPWACGVASNPLMVG